jgi:hypothetical protein
MANQLDGHFIQKRDLLAMKLLKNFDSIDFCVFAQKFDSKCFSFFPISTSAATAATKNEKCLNIAF